MKHLIFLAVTLAIVNALPNGWDLNSELNEEWESFKIVHNKHYYGDDVELLRRQIWERNLKYIQKHNMEHDLGKHTYTLGLNVFADLTHEEFKAYYLNSRRPNRPAGATYMRPLNAGDLPDSVDWRSKGYVTPVKDQQQCGSCWAFSTTGSMEGQYFRKTNTLLSFSEQQLVDCSGYYGNQGCNGGLMDQAFDYIKDEGLELESDYPYTALDGQCNYDASKVQTKLVSYTDIPQGDEDSLKDAVANVGPISVAIDASHSSFQFYKSGVYNELQCSSTELDHGVLAVGYGSENNSDYWLVKNSWGPSWGLQGYIKMSRNQNNQCGIATAASYPQL